MDRESLRLLLAQGLSLEEIGRRYGKHPSTVGYWVQKHGLEAAGRAKHAPKGGIPREELERRVGLGLSAREIAADLHLSLSTVRHWLKRHGLRTEAAVSRDLTRDGPPTVKRRCRRHGIQVFRRLRSGHYRCSRCNSAAVAARRRRVKLELVQEAGGACVLCGYDRNPAALQFHHLDPATKEFGLAHGGLSISMERARAEAAKCVLLCANCHAEVEVGAVTLPLQLAAAPR